MRIDRIKLISELARQNITQLELAKRCKYSRSTINGICNGKSCSERTAEAIAGALNITVDDLMEV